MELTPAFVLHHRPYRETSQLLDVFSREYGRISLVARGSRKQKRNPSLQLFQPLLISWYGKGELLNLSQVEVNESAFRLTGRASFCGFYLNELLLRLIPLFEPEIDLFDTYQKTLLALQTEPNQQIILRLFEKRLLMILGYGLQLHYEADNQTEIDDEARYHYQIERGPVRLVQNSESLNGIQGRSLRHLEEEAGFDEISLREIKYLMRTVIDYYLGGKPLHSRKLFNDLQQFK